MAYPGRENIYRATIRRMVSEALAERERAFCLPAPKSTESIQSFARVQQETENQQEIYRRKKNEKKLRAQKKEAEREAKRCMYPPKNGGS